MFDYEKLTCYWSVVGFELEGIFVLGDLREVFEIF